MGLAGPLLTELVLVLPVVLPAAATLVAPVTAASL